MFWKTASGFCFVFVLCIFLTLAAAPAEGQIQSGRQRITCESTNNQRNQCNVSIGGDVRLVRQLSNTQCVEGRNWGWSQSGIWVDNGCRAEFEFNTWSDTRPAAGRQRMTCESVNNERNQCNANIGGDVRLSRQLSSTQCVEGRNWGWSSSAIWVDNGCRAEFEFNTWADSRRGNRGDYGRNRGRYGDTQLITCESKNRGRGKTQCKAEIAGDVRLTRQLSDVQCTEGRDWGWQQNHIWVRNGCRAEFEYRERSAPGRRVGQNRQGNPTPSGPLETITCESNNNDYRECSVDRNIRDVRVTQRLSNSSCEQGSSWGLKNDQRTIWVNHGCRAVFEFRRT
jgi:hypothetical protein